MVPLSLLGHMILSFTRSCAGEGLEVGLCFFQKYYLNFSLYFPNTFQGMSKQSLPPRLQVNLQTTRYQEVVKEKAWMLV